MRIKKNIIFFNVEIIVKLLLYDVPKLIISKEKKLSYLKI